MKARTRLFIGLALAVAGAAAVRDLAAGCVAFGVYAVLYTPSR
jgi:hypothetical protein